MRALSDPRQESEDVSIIRDTLDNLSASLRIPDSAAREVAIVRDLADMARRLPILVVVVFRAAFALKFEGGFDTRELTRFIAHACNRVPPAYRSLVCPREAEAIIRADLGGERDLTNRFSYDRDKLYDTLLLLIRVVLLEASEDPVRKAVPMEQVRKACSDLMRSTPESTLVIASVFLGRNATSDEFGRVLQTVELALKG